MEEGGDRSRVVRPALPPTPPPKQVRVSDAVKNLSFAPPLPQPRGVGGGDRQSAKGGEGAVDDAEVLVVPTRATAARGRRRPAKPAQPRVPESDEPDPADADDSQPFLLRTTSYKKGTLQPVLGDLEDMEDNEDEEDKAGDNDDGSGSDEDASGDPWWVRAVLGGDGKAGGGQGGLEDRLERAESVLVGLRESRAALATSVGELRTFVNMAVDYKQLGNDVKRLLRPPQAVPALECELRHMQMFESKKGWMEKEGRMVKSWKKRWFVLRCTSLYYYEADDEKSLKGEVKLDVGKVTLTRSSVQVDTKREALTISSANRVFVFSGPARDLAGWEQAIQAKLACLAYLSRKARSHAEPNHQILHFANHPKLTSFVFGDSGDPGDGDDGGNGKKEGKGEAGAKGGGEGGEAPRRGKRGGTRFLPSDARCVVPYLSWVSGVTSVAFRGVRLSDKSLSLLCTAFERNPGIRILDLSNNRLTDAGARSLAVSFAHFRGNHPFSLCKLVLDNNPLGDAGVAALSGLLSGDATNGLSCLSLRGVGMGDRGAESIAGALVQRGAKPEPFFERLLVDNNSVGDAGAAKLADALKRSQLKDLSLRNNKIGDPGMTAIAGGLEGSSHIRRVNVEANPFSDDVGLVALSRALLRNNTLESANLTPNQRLDAPSLAALRLMQHTLLA